MAVIAMPSNAAQAKEEPRLGLLDRTALTVEKSMALRADLRPDPVLHSVHGPKTYEVNVREPVFASVFGLLDRPSRPAQQEGSHAVPQPQATAPVQAMPTMHAMPITHAISPTHAIPTARSTPTAQASPTLVILDDIDEMERDLSEMSSFSCTIDFGSARDMGFSIEPSAPLRMIKGIGPKTNALLSAADIKTYADLADCSVHQLKSILSVSGPYQRLAKTGNWIKQADLAALNQWGALRQLQGPVSKAKRRKLT